MKPIKQRKMSDKKSNQAVFVAAALTGLISREQANIGDGHKLSYYGEEIINQALLFGEKTASALELQNIREEYFKSKECNQSNLKKRTSIWTFLTTKVWTSFKTS